MLVSLPAFNNNRIELKVQGATNIMVTVVATQALEVGDVLRRFKAKAAYDEPRPGEGGWVRGWLGVRGEGREGRGERAG